MDNALAQQLLLKVPDAARLAAVSRSEGYNLVARGEWPHVRIGAQGSGVRVVVADLLAWIATSKRYGYGQRDDDA